MDDALDKLFRRIARLQRDGTELDAANVARKHRRIPRLAEVDEGDRDVRLGKAGGALEGDVGNR